MVFEPKIPDNASTFIVSPTFRTLYSNVLKQARDKDEPLQVLSICPSLQQHVDVIVFVNGLLCPLNELWYNRSREDEPLGTTSKTIHLMYARGERLHGGSTSHKVKDDE